MKDLEKILIAVSCLVLIYISYDYPIFDNKGITSLVIFACLAIIIFCIAKIYSPTDKDDYGKVEKEMDRLHQLDGIFEYRSDGFSVTLDDKTEFIKWTDILEVNAFTVPSKFRDRQTGLELITKNRSYEFGDDHTEGIMKLGEQLYENLPDWRLDPPYIRMNSFGLEKANLYKKH